jgi:hypothetical protein
MYSVSHYEFSARLHARAAVANDSGSSRSNCFSKEHIGSFVKAIASRLSVFRTIAPRHMNLGAGNAYEFEELGVQGFLESLNQPRTCRHRRDSFLLRVMLICGELGCSDRRKIV